MHNAPFASNGHARTLFAAQLGCVLGSLLQLQQSVLWDWQVYVAIVVLAPVIYALVAIKNIASKTSGLG